MTTYYNTAFMVPGSYQKVQATEAEIEEYKEEVVMRCIFYGLPVPAWTKPSELGVLMAYLPSEEEFETAYVRST